MKYPVPIRANQIDMMRPVQFPCMLLALLPWLVQLSHACPETCDCNGAITACINKGLTDIPKNIPIDTIDLYLNGNHIHTIRQGAFSSLTSLRTLLLKDCQVQEIEGNAFAGLPNLSYLDMKNNSLRALQSYAFSGLSSLGRLTLDHNDIFVINNFAFHGLNLTRLRLEQVTKLHDIAPKAFSSSSISELYIYNSSLTSESVASLIPLKPSLRELSLEFNQLPLVIPQNVFDGFFFRSLKLDYNGITDTSFLDYVATDDLSLEGNPTGPIDFSQYTSMKEVRTLRLANTRFNTVDGKYFEGMTHLTNLYVSSNNIMTLPENLMPVFNQLKRLTLSHNLLFCNCELVWFQTWLTSGSGTTLVDGATCSMPFNDDLIFVDQNDMTCTPPSILSISRNIEVPANSEMTLTCKATGNPPPTITWQLPSGERTATQPSSDRNMTQNTGMLHIGSVGKSDEGQYKCLAQNRAGNVSEITEARVHQAANGHPATNIEAGQSQPKSDASRLVHLTCLCSLLVTSLLHVNVLFVF